MTKLEVPDGLRLWKLLRCLLLEHDHEANDAKAQVGDSATTKTRALPTMIAGR